jgi:hypothetical protein
VLGLCRRPARPRRRISRLARTVPQSWLAGTAAERSWCTLAGMQRECAILVVALKEAYDVQQNRVKEHLAQWTEAGWRLEHVSELFMRFAPGNEYARYSFFWIKDS